MFCAKINRTCLKLTVYWVAYEPSLQITTCLGMIFESARHGEFHTSLLGFTQHDAWFQRCLVNENASRKWVVEDVFSKKKVVFFLKGPTAIKAEHFFFKSRYPFRMRQEFVTPLCLPEMMSNVSVWKLWLAGGWGGRVVEDVGIKFLGLAHPKWASQQQTTGEVDRN